MGSASFPTAPHRHAPDGVGSGHRPPPDVRRLQTAIERGHSDQAGRPTPRASWRRRGPPGSGIRSGRPSMSPRESPRLAPSGPIENISQAHPARHNTPAWARALAGRRPAPGRGPPGPRSRARPAAGTRDFPNGRRRLRFSDTEGANAGPALRRPPKRPRPSRARRGPPGIGPADRSTDSPMAMPVPRERVEPPPAIRPLTAWFRGSRPRS